MHSGFRSNYAAGSFYYEPPNRFPPHLSVGTKTEDEFKPYHDYPSRTAIFVKAVDESGIDRYENIDRHQIQPLESFDLSSTSGGSSDDDSDDASSIAYSTDSWSTQSSQQNPHESDVFHDTSPSNQKAKQSKPIVLYQSTNQPQPVSRTCAVSSISTAQQITNVQLKQLEATAQLRDYDDEVSGEIRELRASRQKDSLKSDDLAGLTRVQTLPEPVSHSLVRPQTAFRNCRRRAGSHGSASLPPPTLKRDTDSTDSFVQLLIAFTCRLVTGIWPTAGTPPMMSSCFNGAGVLPLETFVFETLRRSKTSYSTLQIALYYLILLKPRLPLLDFTKEQPKPKCGQSQQEQHGCRAMQCGRRMFLSALMLASKYIQDRNYSTRAWSKISGLRIPEINENERQYLKLIDYDLHIKKETFDNWSKVVLTLSKLSKDMNPSPVQQTQGTSCTSEWWRSLVADMRPDTFEDATATEDFLKAHVPGDAMSHPMPSLPLHLGQSTVDFTRVFGSGSTPSSTPMQTTAASPNPTTYPIKPVLRKLNTPTATPTPGSLLRTSVSVDALRACPRALQNANIERCPPPVPQHFVPHRSMGACSRPTPPYTPSERFSSPLSQMSRSSDETAIDVSSDCESPPREAGMTAAYTSRARDESELQCNVKGLLQTDLARLTGLSGSEDVAGRISALMKMRSDRQGLWDHQISTTQERSSKASLQNRLAHGRKRELYKDNYDESRRVKRRIGGDVPIRTRYVDQ